MLRLQQGLPHFPLIHRILSSYCKKLDLSTAQSVLVHHCQFPLPWNQCRMKYIAFQSNVKYQRTQAFPHLRTTSIRTPADTNAKNSAKRGQSYYRVGESPLGRVPWTTAPLRKWGFLCISPLPPLLWTPALKSTWSTTFSFRNTPAQLSLTICFNDGQLPPCPSPFAFMSWKWLEDLSRVLD